MAQKKGKKEKQDSLNIDLGIGGLSFGGIFRGIGNLIDLATRLEEAGGEIRKEGELDLSHLKKGMKGVFGVSVKTAVGGKPIVEQFGNIKKTPQGATVEEERQPMTDIFDEKDEVRVYAEMPGVNQEDIKLELRGDILDISARTGDRKYHKELLLPGKVRPDTPTSTYRNGILEVRIRKS